MYKGRVNVLLYLFQSCSYITSNLIFVPDADIDFLTHYKLVDPGLIESYARAFVVEDGDFDTVISSKVG